MAPGTLRWGLEGWSGESGTLEGENGSPGLEFCVGPLEDSLGLIETKIGPLEVCIGALEGGIVPLETGTGLLGVCVGPYRLQRGTL